MATKCSAQQDCAAEFSGGLATPEKACGAQAQAQPLRAWWVVSRAATTNGDGIMTTLSRLRLLGAAALVSSAAALSAAAQTQTPAPDTQTTPPAAKPEPAPTPPTGMKPSEPPKSPTMPSGNKQSAAPAKNPMIGLAVFSSDGNKLGPV